MFYAVMLNAVKHPCTGFLAALGMTSLVMLSEVKHLCTGFLATARNDKRQVRNSAAKPTHSMGLAMLCGKLLLWLRLLIWFGLLHRVARVVLYWIGADVSTPAPALI